MKNLGNYNLPTFWDANADGLVDLFISNATGHIMFWQNEGSVSLPSFTQMTGPGCHPVRVGPLSPCSIVTLKTFRKQPIVIPPRRRLVSAWNNLFINRGVLWSYTCLPAYWTRVWRLW